MLLVILDTLLPDDASTIFLMLTLVLVVSCVLYNHIFGAKNDIELIEYPNPDSPITETQARSSMTELITIEDENRKSTSSNSDIELKTVASQDEAMKPRLEYPDPDTPITETQARGLMTEIIS